MSPVRQVTLLKILILLAPFVLLPLTGIPHALPLAIFFVTAIFWLTELLPLPVTALMVPVLATSTGVLTMSEAFKPFGSEIPFLFLGCFLLAQSIEKHGLDKRIAFAILGSPLGAGSPGHIVRAVAVACFMLSMWISNTAACAMVTPVCLGLIRIYNQYLKDEGAQRNFATRLLIACAFGASIGGMATPVGSPPNLIAIQFLKDHGIAVSFANWMYYGLPISVIALIGLLLILSWRYPLPKKVPEQLTTFLISERAQLGSMTIAQVQTTIVFVLAICFWVLPDLFAISADLKDWSDLLKQRFPMSTVALGCGLLLFFLPTNKKDPQSNLTWQDALKVDWGTIFLFGGGLVLSAVLDHSRLAESIGKGIFSTEAGVFTIIALGIGLSLVLSEFASNTASAAIVIPIVFAAISGSTIVGIDPQPIIIAVALGASFGFMLPVSTPPNAIIFGTGKIRSGDLIKTGIFFDLFGTLLVLGVIWILH